MNDRRLPFRVVLLSCVAFGFFFACGRMAWGQAAATGKAEWPDHAISPNQFQDGSDSDRIEAAIAEALKTGVNSVEIPRMNRKTGQPIWLIERAILIPSDFTLVLSDCLVRLAPGTKDNILANAGSRTSPLSGNKNVRILGKGSPVLSGGVGSNWEKPGDKNGWRTIGLLLYDTQHFTLDGFQMEETQTWAISLENGCAYGRIANIDFANSNKYPNQDGVDLRKGCHDILIENITGDTGDDSVALTGLRNDNPDPLKPSMQVGGPQSRENDDIYNITIRDIRTRVCGGHHIVRLLNHDGIKLYNIFISNVMDASGPKDARAKAAIRIGDVGYSSMAKNKLGETYNIFIDNVLSRAETVVKIQGTLKNATLRNIVGYDVNSQLVETGSVPTQNVIVDGHRF
jgi:polygalacturonase